MSVEDFRAEAKKWLGKAKNPRWKRPYTELTYLPMQEVIKYLRDNGYKTYIVTGGGQDFVRVYRREDLRHPARAGHRHGGRHEYGYGKDGKPFLTKEPKLLLNDNNAGKPEGIDLMIGRRPQRPSATPPATSQMLEYTTAGDGARACDVHPSRRRCSANTLTGRPPDCPRPGRRVYAGALRRSEEEGWSVISMKNDWKKIFAFDAN